VAPRRYCTTPEAPASAPPVVAMPRSGRTVLATCCALGISACAGAAAPHLDSSVLVQEAVQTHQHQHAAARAQAGLLKAQLLASIASGQRPSVFPQINCDESPLLCQAPFNCQNFEPEPLVNIVLSKGLAPDGEINWQLWCLTPMYGPYMHSCIIDKDLVQAAKLQYQWSVNQHIGIDEMDASYCFIEGHCTNEAVTNKTTVEEGIQMCDERFGRQSWAMTGSAAALASQIPAAFTLPKVSWNGFHDPRHTKYFLKAACAMGNYHCDVMYCKETYCKNPYFVKKYGHMLPSAPGHLLQSLDRLQ